MAKSKTARKGSGTSSSKKKTEKEGKGPSKSQKAPKSSELLCDHCQKPMKDIKTKKLHERNCKNKKKDKTKGKKKPAEKKDKDFDSAIRKMRDEFEDQRQHLEDKYQDREEKFHRELGEIKEVLRLEMEHRHKERARIKKEEASKEGPPRKPAPPDARSPESMAVPPPTPQEENVPRAIDRIPVPIPTIPERKVRDQGPIVEVVEVGTIGPRSEDTIAPSSELPKEEILNIVREEIETFSLKLKEEEKIDTALPELDGLRKDVQDLMSQLADMKRNIQYLSSKKIPKINTTLFEQEFKRIDRELGKFSEKIMEIMDEIGFGESLSVSKIPPTILEIVYQATLDDLTRELMKTAGSQDAEKISRSALEEVRLKTSGSELFKFDGRKIVTDNLAKTIEGDLISAKQIQTTYEELLSRFLEHLPHHKAKNFRSMIKVKSQEFAVDRATVLTKDFERMRKHLETTSQMLAALSAQIIAKNLKLEEELQEIKEKLLPDKADLSDIELLRIKLEEREEREAAIMNDLGLLKAEVEMKKELAKTPKKEKKNVKEEEKEPVKEDLEGILLEAITGGASSKTALKKKTGLDEKAILSAISKLVEKNKVIEKKVGNYLSYQTPEQAFKEKLDDKVEAEKRTPSKKGKEPSKRSGVGKAEKDEKEKDDTKSKKKKVEKKEKAEDKEKKVTKKKTEKVKPDKKKKVEETKPEEKGGSDEPVGGSAEPIGGSDEPVAEPVQKPKKKKEDRKKKPEEEPEKEPEAPAKEKEEAVKKAKRITVPSESKSLEELNEDERKVLEVITESGLTRTGIQSKVGKDMKYTSVLRALRVLIDSGYVGILTKGRLTIYQKLKVEKVEKTKKEENKTEVK